MATGSIALPTTNQYRLGDSIKFVVSYSPSSLDKGKGVKIRITAYDSNNVNIWTDERHYDYTFVLGGSSSQWKTYGVPAVCKVVLKAKSTQLASLSFNALGAVIPPPIPPSTYGPRIIAQPAGSVSIPIGTTIQSAINANPSGTSFWVAAGTRNISGVITPKVGNKFTGEYGSILDGTSWNTSNVDDGCFGGTATAIVIDNLVITNMPQKGISTDATATSGWTIQFCEVSYCKTGISLPSLGIAQYNFIHHNSKSSGTIGGGYTAFRATSPQFLYNEISYNGPEQKLVQTTGATVKGNFVHHNLWNGIWLDTDNSGYIIEDNTIEDHLDVGSGIIIEISGAGIIRNNTIRRNADTAILVTTSSGVESYGNTLENNFRAIQYYLNCPSLSDGYDLTNNNAHDNIITVPVTAGAFASMLSNNSGCSAPTMVPYLNLSKNNVFQNNRYTVPNVAATIFVWGFGVTKTFTQWQALPEDSTGTIT